MHVPYNLAYLPQLSLSILYHCIQSTHKAWGSISLSGFIRDKELKTKLCHVGLKICVQGHRSQLTRKTKTENKNRFTLGSMVNFSDI